MQSISKLDSRKYFFFYDLITRGEREEGRRPRVLLGASKLVELSSITYIISSSFLEHRQRKFQKYV